MVNMKIITIYCSLLYTIKTSIKKKKNNINLTSLYNYINLLAIVISSNDNIRFAFNYTLSF